MAQDEPAIQRLVEIKPKLPRDVAIAYVRIRDWARDNGYRLVLYQVKK